MHFSTVFFTFCVLTWGYVQTLENRIVGGIEVNIEDFPYQVSVRYFDSHLCGGAIIDSNTILTAAHCIYGFDWSKFSIRAGSNIHFQGISHKVTKIRIHPFYNPNNFNNDIAILKISISLVFGSKILPIPLQYNNMKLYSGTIAWVSGWGVLQEGSKLVPNRVRATYVIIVSTPECNAKYASNTITSQMLCAQNSNKNVCQGDSGGPLVFNGRLIGIVSFGIGCARLQYPAVYTKISAAYNWIANNRY